MVGPSALTGPEVLALVCYFFRALYVPGSIYLSLVKTCSSLQSLHGRLQSISGKCKTYGLGSERGRKHAHVSLPDMVS